MLKQAELPSHVEFGLAMAGRDDYGAMIQLTCRVVARRTRDYRNLVVAVVVIGSASGGWALVSRSTTPLAGLMVLLPVCAGFVWQDRLVLNHWRRHVLACWALRRLDTRALRDAMTVLPTLPRETLAGMLASLPEAGDIREERTISLAIRRGVATIVMASDACHADSLGIKAAGFIVTTATCLFAIIVHAWQPFLSLIAVLLLPHLQKAMRWARCRAARHRLQIEQQKLEFDQDQFFRPISALKPETKHIVETMQCCTGSDDGIGIY